MTVQFDLTHIEALIPHRPPFLFIESACLVSPLEVSAVARWHAGHPILAGHFPGFPLVPGVLMVEAAAQAAGVLVAASRPVDERLGMLTGIRRASFHAPVFADDACLFTVCISQVLGDMMTATAQARVGRHGVAFKGEFTIAVADRARLAAPVDPDRTTSTSPPT